MDADGFIERVEDKAAYMREALINIFDGTDVTVVGMGMMLGIKVPGKQKEFISKSMENRLLVVPAGNDVVRIYAPLNISQDDLDTGLEKISKTAADLGLGG